MTGRVLPVPAALMADREQKSSFLIPRSLITAWPLPGVWIS